MSALTTCGFSTVSEQTWSLLSRLLMIIAMVFGAVSGSTVGGIKLDRIVVLYKSVEWYLRLVYHGSPEDLRYRLNGRTLAEKEAHRHLKSAAVLAFLWIVTLTADSSILFHTTGAQHSLLNILFECASALETSGLSVGITGPGLSLASKLTLMFLMWLGRLEIISVLVLFSWLGRFPQESAAALTPGNSSQEHHHKNTAKELSVAKLSDIETPSPQTRSPQNLGSGGQCSKFDTSHTTSQITNLAADRVIRSI